MDDWSFAFGARQTDRAAERRGDAAGIGQMLAGTQTRILPLWNGKPLIAANGAAGWLCPGDRVLAQGGVTVFLGLRDGTAMFAQDLSGWQPPADAPLPGQGFFDATEQHHPDAPGDWRFAELRGVMATLPAADAADAAAARSLLAWHRSHGFCACCGQPTAVGRAGWQRDCGACGAAHFPRTDPVVIMRIVAGNRILLGRSPGWPSRMYSLLAGFVEPGETVEDAVRREVAEETGVAVGGVRYLASQPWPYPSSLMIGCEGQATSVAITLDPAELEDALWLSREDLAQVFAGRHPDIAPPRRGAIAASLMADWLADRRP